MAQTNYNKGFVVNSSVISAQSLDVSKSGSESSSTFLGAVIADAKIKAKKANDAFLKVQSEKALLQSLSDGSAFAPSYGGSYTKGSYAGGSYGSFGIGGGGSADPDAVLVDVVSQGRKNPSAIFNSEPRRSPVQTTSKPTWEDIVKQYKWWIVGVTVAVLYFVFRRQN